MLSERATEAQERCVYCTYADLPILSLRRITKNLDLRQSHCSVFLQSTLRLPSVNKSSTVRRHPPPTRCILLTLSPSSPPSISTCRPSSPPHPYLHSIHIPLSVPALLAPLYPPPPATAPLPTRTPQPSRPTGESSAPPWLQAQPRSTSKRKRLPIVPVIGLIRYALSKVSYLPRPPLYPCLSLSQFSI